MHSQARAGARAVCAWQRRCRVAVGEVQGESFVKSLEGMMESVSLYRAEIWGSCRQTDALREGSIESSKDLPGGWPSSIK